MRNLPFHNIPVNFGLNTFYNPETQVGAGFSALSNMDGNREYRSLGTVGGSAVATASITDNILSGHYFEYVDLDRSRQRKTLWYNDAGALYIGDSSSPTSLKTGLISATTGLRAAVFANQFYFTSPTMTALGPRAYRYAGNTVDNWGVHAPGDEWEEEVSLDSSASVSPTVNGTVATNTTNFLYGSGAVTLNKLGSGGTGSIFTVSHAEDWSDSTRTRFRMFLYLPYSAIQYGNPFNNPFASFQVFFQDSAGDTVSFVWSLGDLSPGWNELQWDIDDPDNTGGTYDPALQTNILFITTGTSSSAVSGMVVDSIQRVEHDGYPTLAIGAAGNLTGDYRYRVSFVANDGTESNLGPVSGTITATADQISLTDIPVAADVQVLARRLYRDKDGDGIFKLVTTIADPDSTSYTDNTADGSLGGAVGPIAGDDELDNTPPTRFSAVCVHQGRIFGVDADARNTVWPSDLGVPGAFPIVRQMTFEDPIVSMVSQQSGLILHGHDHTYLLTGDGTDVSPWYAVQLSDHIGADTYRSTCSIRNFNLTVYERRVYLYEDIREPWYISGPVQDQLDAYDAEDIFVVHDVKRSRILFFVDATNVGFAYNYGSKALSDVSPDGPGIDPLDPRTGVWSKLTFPASYSIRCAVHVDSTADVSRVAVGNDDAKAYFINEDDYSWATTASTEAVAASFTSHPFPLGIAEQGAPAGAGGRGEPRFLHIDAVGVGATTTWTFTINLLHDPGATAFATVNVTATIAVGQNTFYLPIPPVGRGAWVSVSASCSSSTGRARFRLLRLYYLPRSKSRGPKE